MKVKVKHGGRKDQVGTVTLLKDGFYLVDFEGFELAYLTSEVDVLPENHMRIEDYITVCSAIELMARDNGCINRNTTFTDILEECDTAITGKYTDEQMQHFEDVLLAYDEEELFTLTSGDQDDPVCRNLDPETSDFLNFLFDQL